MILSLNYGLCQYVYRNTQIIEILYQQTVDIGSLSFYLGLIISVKSLHHSSVSRVSHDCLLSLSSEFVLWVRLTSLMSPSREFVSRVLWVRLASLSREFVLWVRLASLSSEFVLWVCLVSLSSEFVLWVHLTSLLSLSCEFVFRVCLMSPSAAGGTRPTPGSH